MKKALQLLGAILLLTMILAACGGGQQSEVQAEVKILTDYRLSVDPIVKAYEVGNNQGEYTVYRQMGMYFTNPDGESREGPNAVYVTYFWLKANETTPACPETFAGIARHKCELAPLGTTDLFPAYIRYSTTMFYGPDLNSSDQHMKMSENFNANTMPPACELTLENDPIQDCTVTIIVPVP